MIKKTLLLTLHLDHSVPHDTLCEYIVDSLLSWQGSLKPPGLDHNEEDEADPMWDNVKQIVVGRSPQ